MNRVPHETTAGLDQFDELLVVRPRPPAPVDTEIDITPMIDMVFLLLIFFLVTSRMSQQASVDLPPARYGGAISAKDAVVITVAETGGEVAIFKGDGISPQLQLAATDAATQEAELIAYVQAERNGPRPRQHVLVKAGSEVKHKHVARVSQAVGRALGGGEVYYAVRESQ